MDDEAARGGRRLGVVDGLFSWTAVGSDLQQIVAPAAAVYMDEVTRASRTLPVPHEPGMTAASRSAPSASVTDALPPLPMTSDLVFALGNAQHFGAVISLAGDWRGTGPLFSHPRRLYLPFEDTVLRDDRGALTSDDVVAVLDFVAGSAGSMLVHCRFGQSRSTAVALGIATALGHDPSTAADALLANHLPGRPFIPNALVLDLFDQVLGLDGKLVEAGRLYRF